MKKTYQELVVTLCLIKEKDVLTLSGETGPDGLIVDRGWGGKLK